MLRIGQAAGVGQGRQEGVEDQRRVRIVGHDLGDRGQVQGRADGADLEGGDRHVFQQGARLLGHPVAVELVHILDAGTVRDQQAGDGRQPVASEGGERGAIRLHAEGADGIADAEAQDEGERLVLHVG